MNPYSKIGLCVPTRARTANTKHTLICKTRLLSGPKYEQIPEHLKIHMFSSELEIIKTDELKSPFRNFTSDQILNLLERRANEVRLARANSNPSSRMNNANIVRFMKVASRLKQLFAVNGGNTEVLDAVIQSQTTLDAFEAKLAAKKAKGSAAAATSGLHSAARNVSDAPVKTKVKPAVEHKPQSYAPGPYLQIPDKLQIHDFTDELRLFRDEELKAPYASASAASLIKLMDEKIKAVHSGAESKGVSAANLVAFYNLRSKLNRLLTWNGGVTSVLDTILHSQDVFEKFESRRKASQTTKFENTSPSVYRQLPDHVALNEYATELSTIREDLGQVFEKATSFEVLASVSRIANSDIPINKKIAFNKLYRNLVALFRYNGNQTFVLDTIMLNTEVFRKMESKLAHGEAGSSASTKYRDSDYIISLLNSQNTDSMEPTDEVTIRSAVVHSMSPEEKKVFEADPEEFDRIHKMTANKIREQYKAAAPSMNKSEVERFLKKIKKEKDIAEEYRWREREAFEWSTHLSSDRSLARSNFFNINPRSRSFPMFPGNDTNMEYLVLAPGGQQFASTDNPLGVGHIPQRMFEILESIPEHELQAFSKNIEKLRKKGWKLIGGGHNGELLVLSREKSSPRRVIVKVLKTALLSVGVCVGSLVLVNLWVEDPVVVVEEAPSSEHLETAPESSWKTYLWRK